MPPARIAIVLLLFLFPGCQAGTVDDLVAAVSQESYTSHLKNHLYTRLGDNRDAAAPGPEHGLTRDYIIDQFRSIGLDTYVHSFRFAPPAWTELQGAFTVTNVVGRLVGTVHPEQQVILGAHYDSVANPGADDNASGVAGVLEAARILAGHRFERTILFIVFDCEELAWAGSARYAQEHLADQIVGMVELDMIAYNHKGLNKAEVWTGTYGSPEPNPVSKALLAAVARYARGLTAIYGGADPASDHGPFAAAGFPSALLTEGDPYSPYYHQKKDAATDADGNDTILEDGSAYLDYAYATALTRAAVGWLAEAAVPARPGRRAPLRPR